MEYRTGDKFKDVLTRENFIITDIYFNTKSYFLKNVNTCKKHEMCWDVFDAKIKNGTFINIKTPTTAAKADDGKVPLQLLCPTALEGTAKVLQFGRDKYTKITGKDASHNWKLGMPWSKVIGSILRHLFAIMRGEDIDSDSGLPHVDHLGCEIMFLQSYMAKGIGEDDRYKYKGDES